MPHVSGGGSHGGGSFSHSSSRSYSGGSHGGGSSSGSGSSLNEISFRPKPGAARYVYTDRWGHTRYLYTKSAPTRNPDIGVSIVVAVLFTLLAAGILWFVLQFTIFVPQKANTSFTDEDIVILDCMELIKDDSELRAALHDFMETTGVCPGVEITADSNWTLWYTDMETYAYSEYLRLYDDELHWLILISYPDDYEIAEFVNWRWVGMVGDDLSATISSEAEDKLTTAMQRYLLRSQPEETGTAVASAFRELSSTVMESKVYGTGVFVCVVVFLIYALFMYVTLEEAVKQWMLSKAVRDSKPNLGRTEAKRKVRYCEYCGCENPVNGGPLCTQCGAPLPRQDKAKK